MKVIKTTGRKHVLVGRCCGDDFSGAHADASCGPCSSFWGTVWSKNPNFDLFFFAKCPIVAVTIDKHDIKCHYGSNGIVTHPYIIQLSQHISLNLISRVVNEPAELCFPFSPLYITFPLLFDIVRLKVDRCRSLLSLLHMICPFRHPSLLSMIISALDTTAISASSPTMAINHFKSLPSHAAGFPSCVIVERKKNPILHLLVSVYIWRHLIRNWFGQA